MTVIGIISKRFLVSNVLSKVPNVLIMVQSNYFNFKANFLSLGFPTSRQRFSRISVMSESGLYFDLRPSQTCHSKVMHRKEMTHSNGSYERKSRRRAWLTKWDKVKNPMVHS